jgi:hypothetical protein
MKKRTKWIGAGICIVIVLFVLAYVNRESILIQAGKYMAPECDAVTDTAEVVILEGTEFIGRSLVTKGRDLLSAGKAKRLVVVLHRIAPSHRPFALNDDYTALVRKELETLGLGESEFKIIVTPIRNPVTLTSAGGALEALSKDGVRSAILISPGFHMRRSFLAYRHLGTPLHITIYPYACFDSYQPDNWWKQDNGLRDFATELTKLIYYMIRGYIPLRFSC